MQNKICLIAAFIIYQFGEILSNPINTNDTITQNSTTETHNNINENTKIDQRISAIIFVLVGMAIMFLCLCIRNHYYR